MRHLNKTVCKRRVVDSKEWLDEDRSDEVAERAIWKRKMDARRKIEDGDYGIQAKIDVLAEKLSKLIDQMR
jgi:hypothetical protein